MPTVTPTDAQFGIAEEPSYGVRAAPTRYYPLAPGTKIKYDRARVESDAVVAGLDIIGSDQWAPGAVKVEVDFGFELYRDHIGLLLKHMFGSVSSASTVHTFTPGPIDDLSLCGHLDLAPVGGSALIPVELLGCKISEWELAAKYGEKATLGLTVVAQNALFGTGTVTDGVTTLSGTAKTVTSASAAFTQADVGKLITDPTGTKITAGTTIASVESATSITLSAAAIGAGTGVTLVIGAPIPTPSYGSLAASPFMFDHASVTVNSSALEVKNMAIKGSNTLATNRGHLGSALIAEPLREGRREFTVDLGREFRDLYMIAALKSGIEAAVVVRFAAGSTSLVITMNCRWDEATPTSEPTSLADESLKLKVTRPTTNASAITAVLTSASATV